MIKLTQAQVNELFSEGGGEFDGVGYEVIEEGEFSQDYKYQTAAVIFTDGERNYRSYITRSGSPFSDWHYEDHGMADIDVVEKREVTVSRWVAV